LGLLLYFFDRELKSDNSPGTPTLMDNLAIRRDKSDRIRSTPKADGEIAMPASCSGRSDSFFWYQGENPSLKFANPPVADNLDSGMRAWANCSKV
jgi:hypothetical protein